MQVYMIVANNPTDFDDDDVWVVGATKAAAEAELQRVLKARWEEMDEQTKDFYGQDAYEYEQAWKIDWQLKEVATNENND